MCVLASAVLPSIVDACSRACLSRAPPALCSECRSDFAGVKSVRSLVAPVVALFCRASRAPRWACGSGPWLWWRPVGAPAEGGPSCLVYCPSGRIAVNLRPGFLSFILLGFAPCYRDFEPLLCAPASRSCDVPPRSTADCPECVLGGVCHGEYLASVSSWVSVSQAFAMSLDGCS